MEVRFRRDAAGYQAAFLAGHHSEVLERERDNRGARNMPKFRRPRLSSRAWLPLFVALPLLTGFAVPAGPVPAALDASASNVAASLSDAETALRSLAGHVPHMSHPEALETAFEVYYAYRATNQDKVRKPYLYFVDLGLDNRTPRGYVFDMDRLELVEGPFTVSHGSGSSSVRDAVPTVFSNRPGSYTSSLGLYLTEETYGFRGTANGKPYTSVGLRLRGESGRFNDAARERGIVVHGAPYVTAAAAGRSQGCPAMEPERAERLLPLIAHGALVFIYSPNDERWLNDGPWLRAAQQQQQQ
jgi:hypothetical protein